jgi:ATP-dependent DNA helicase RecG
MHCFSAKKNTIKKPALLVIDEQHRFGVKQRKALSELKNIHPSPHVLQLTATPIPRSLALTLFGNLEVSVVNKPKERIKVDTLLVPSLKRRDSYNWLENSLKNGSKVFWVFPLIEQNSETEGLAIEEKFPEIKKTFGRFGVGMLHGRMSNEQKDNALTDFKKGKNNILVSTTVIEVGIDIADADIIIIENAEMFGLAQLHQLRGRVGRGVKKSFCILFTAKESDSDALERLKYFKNENNGIKLAEYDLKTRGPGEVYGTVQSGIPPLKIATFKNKVLLKNTRAAAKEILVNKI